MHQVQAQTQTGRSLLEMHRLLLDYFGNQEWWPGETPLEVMVGAVLTQNTNWTNVEKAISNLKARDLLSLAALNEMSIQTLAEEIRPAGYFNIKAKRLKNLVRFVMERYDGSLEDLANEAITTLREELLSVNGVGPETADSIMLYALEKPVFVVDTYTHRILLRHGMADEQITYHELQELFLDHLPEDRGLFNEFHALIVKTGKDYCRKKPRCSECPLGTWEGGPVLEYD